MKSKLVSASVEAVYTQNFASLDDLKVGQCIEIWTPSNKKLATCFIISVPSDSSLCVVLLDKKFKPVSDFIRIPKEAASSMIFDTFYLTSIKGIGQYIGKKLDDIETELEFLRNFTVTSDNLKYEDIDLRIRHLHRVLDSLGNEFTSQCVDYFYKMNNLIMLDDLSDSIGYIGYQDTIHVETSNGYLSGYYTICEVPGEGSCSIFNPYVLAKVVNGSTDYSTKFEYYFKKSDKISKLV